MYVNTLRSHQKRVLKSKISIRHSYTIVKCFLALSRYVSEQNVSNKIFAKELFFNNVFH